MFTKRVFFFFFSFEGAFFYLIIYATPYGMQNLNSLARC